MTSILSFHESWLIKLPVFVPANSYQYVYSWSNVCM